MVDYTGRNIQTSIKEGIEESGPQKDDNVYHDIKIADMKLNYLRYPAILIIPDRTDYLDGSKFMDFITVAFYYQKGRSYNYMDMEEEIDKVIESIKDKLNDNSNIYNQTVNNITHNFGESGGTGLFIIEVEFRIKKLIDLG